MQDFCPHVNDIMFDVNGKLINGQHTLSAIVETGKTYNIMRSSGACLIVCLLILMDTTSKTHSSRPLRRATTKNEYTWRVSRS